MSTPQGGVPIGTFPDGPGSGNGIISDDTLIELAGTASSITVDGQTTTERSVNELVELDKYLRGRKASSNGWGCIGRARAIPPSGSGRDAC